MESPDYHTYENSKIFVSALHINFCICWAILHTYLHFCSWSVIVLSFSSRKVHIKYSAQKLQIGKLIAKTKPSPACFSMFQSLLFKSSHRQGFIWHCYQKCFLGKVHHASNGMKSFARQSGMSDAKCECSLLLKVMQWKKCLWSE